MEQSQDGAARKDGKEIMTDFKFNCPHCQQSLEAPPELFGQTIECPACKGSIAIPSFQGDGSQIEAELEASAMPSQGRTVQSLSPDVHAQARRGTALSSTQVVGLLLLGITVIMALACNYLQVIALWSLLVGVIGAIILIHGYFPTSSMIVKLGGGFLLGLTVPTLVVSVTVQGPKKDAPSQLIHSAQLTHPALVICPPRVSYDVVRRWTLGKSGEGKVIVVDASLATEKDLESLMHQLGDETTGDQWAFVQVFTSREAAQMRDQLESGSLTDKQIEFYDQSAVGAYLKSQGKCEYMTINPQGLRGPTKKLKPYSCSRPSSPPPPKVADGVRTEMIKHAFSVWDGSHRGLEECIKKGMNDPKSYEHVETQYWDEGDHLIVKTTFRGKNVFGGVVPNWVKAKCDLAGNVIEVIEQGP